MPRPIRAVVNLAAIAYNLELIKKIQPEWHCMPVVKANAYGHGLERVVNGLQAADLLATLELDGAAKLRALGWNKPIVLLEGFFNQSDLIDAQALKLDFVVHSDAQLDALALFFQAAGKLAYKPRLFIKLNTGMNRLGFPEEQAAAAIASVKALVQQHELPAPVLMTHFANADAADMRAQRPSPARQHTALMAAKPDEWLCSLGNSAAVLNCPELAGNIVRPGIAIYGASPGPRTAAEYGLRPAMQLCSEIIALQKVSAGQRVGYGSRWQAPIDSTIAVVACGYADGYPRHAPDGTPTWVNGHVAPLAGRVSMDMLTIDVTHIPGAQVGSVVQLWGEQLPVDTVAGHCGTIAYELLCAVTPRVPFTVIDQPNI